MAKTAPPAGPNDPQPFAVRFPWNSSELPAAADRGDLVADWRAVCRDYGGTPVTDPQSWETVQGGSGQWFLIATGTAIR